LANKHAKLKLSQNKFFSDFPDVTRSTPQLNLVPENKGDNPYPPFSLNPTIVEPDGDDMVISSGDEFAVFAEGLRLKRLAPLIRV
jgi:hypothetical protein